MDSLRIWQHLWDRDRPVPRAAVDTARRAGELALRGDWDAAEAQLASCVAELEEAERPEAAAANHNLAAVLQERGELDGAVFHAVRALFLYNRIEDAGGIYAALRNLAVIHASRGETGLATVAQANGALARRALSERGLLELAEGGRDARGEPLHMLGVESARRRLAAAG